MKNWSLADFQPDGILLLDLACDYGEKFSKVVSKNSNSKSSSLNCAFRVPRNMDFNDFAALGTDLHLSQLKSKPCIEGECEASKLGEDDIWHNSVLVRTTLDKPSVSKLICAEVESMFECVKRLEYVHEGGLKFENKLLKTKETIDLKWYQKLIAKHSFKEFTNGFVDIDFLLSFPSLRLKVMHRGEDVGSAGKRRYLVAESVRANSLTLEVSKDFKKVRYIFGQ